MNEFLRHICRSGGTALVAAFRDAPGVVLTDSPAERAEPSRKQPDWYVMLLPWAVQQLLCL